MSQNLQNMQNKSDVWAAAQPCRRRKAAGWQAFPDLENGFDGFASFVKTYEI